MQQDFRSKSGHIPVAREGIPYIGVAAFVTLIAAVLGCGLIAWPMLFVTLAVGHFFRDPERVLSVEDDDVVSPADGRIIAIERVPSTRFVTVPCLKISIFMSPLDVHVNRIPVSGMVNGLYYQKGRFRVASLSRASIENEQNWLCVRTASGADIVLTQVAGLVARRIVCWPRVGDQVERGERFGLIRFGSRVDIYVPASSEIHVSKGQHVYAGETALCRLT